MLELLTFWWFTCVKVFSLILRDCALQKKKCIAGVMCHAFRGFVKCRLEGKKGVLVPFCSVIINLVVLTWWVKFISAERYKKKLIVFRPITNSFEWEEMKWRGTLDTIISYILVLSTHGPTFLNFLDLCLRTKKNYVCSAWWKTAVWMIQKVRNKLKLHPCKFSWRFGSTIRGYN